MMRCTGDRIRSMLASTHPGLVRQLAALLYDSLLILSLILLLVALATGLQALLTGAGGTAGDTIQLHPRLVQVLVVIAILGFYSGFWRLQGQTLGMQAWRIQLRGRGGRPLTWWRCLLRCGCAVLSLLPLGMGFWWCLFDRQSRSWHDHLSATELYLLPKNKG